MLPVIPVRFTCILQGTFCDTGIPHNFYGEKICSVLHTYYGKSVFTNTFFLFLTGGRTEGQIRKVSSMNPRLKQTNKQTGIPLIKTNKLTNRYITTAFDSFL